MTKPLKYLLIHPLRYIKHLIIRNCFYDAPDLIKTGGEWVSSVDVENLSSFSCFVILLLSSLTRIWQSILVSGVAGIEKACVVAQPHPKVSIIAYLILKLIVGAR